jgi:hypothetical protein
MLKNITHQIRSCNYPFVERVLAVDTSPLSGDKIYRYNVGSQEQLDLACQTLPSLYCIEKSTTDYYLHFDADMLLHQDQDYNWIAEAIEVMASTPTIRSLTRKMV